MAVTRVGEVPKKETVYDGPAVQSANAGPGASRPVKETVYGGPANSPAQSGAAPARPAISEGSNKAANVFFLIAGFSLLNTLLLSSGAVVVTAIGLGITRVVFRETVNSGGDTTPAFLLSAVLIAAFAALGVFARRGRSIAFLIGLLLYGADTAVLCWDGVALHLPSILIHAIFLVGMFKGYRAAQE